MTMAGEPATMATEPATIRTMADVERNLPRWVMRLVWRLGKLEHGRMYRFTIVMAGDEPVWAIEGEQELENIQGVLKSR